MLLRLLSDEPYEASVDPWSGLETHFAFVYVSRTLPVVKFAYKNTLNPHTSGEFRPLKHGSKITKVAIAYILIGIPTIIRLLVEDCRYSSLNGKQSNDIIILS